MKNGEIVKSNELMKEAIKLAQDEAKYKARNLVNDDQVDEDTIKSVKGYKNKIDNVDEQMSKAIKGVGISYSGIKTHAISWDPETDSSNYGYYIEPSDVKEG
jgi:hypothetical protein